MNKIPKRTDYYGGYEFSTFVDNPDDLDKYTEVLAELADFAISKGHHDISDILDIVNNSINDGNYRFLHSYLGPFIKITDDLHNASLN